MRISSIDAILFLTPKEVWTKIGRSLHRSFLASGGQWGIPVGPYVACVAFHPRMRTLLLHVAQGYSLREPTTVARAAGLAAVSDVALLKRFKSAGPWFRELSVQLLTEAKLTPLKPPGLRMQLIDATHVQEPGQTGRCWRLHYAFTVPTFACQHFSLTSTMGKGVGESFAHFPVSANDCLIGGRGYSQANGVASVADGDGVVLVRSTPFQMPLLTLKGKRFQLNQALARWPQQHQRRTWQCAVAHPDGGVIGGRLVAIRKSQTAAEAAMQRARRKASQKQYSLKRPVLEYAKYVMVFTTLPEERVDAERCLAWYRVRWQMEFVFQRLKALAALEHLPKHAPASSQAWLYGKLFVGLLTEALIRYGESIAPWGVSRTLRGLVSQAVGVSSRLLSIKSNRPLPPRSHWTL